jgi:hypothetical protein
MRQTKYRAVKTVVDGIRFDSKLEAKRYQELRLLEQSKAISALICQERFPITVPSTSGRLAHICDYIADFAYWSDGCRVVEDVKGMRTPVYRLKKKLVEAMYGITITEWPPKRSTSRRKR